jgi:hypothetical protein
MSTHVDPAVAALEVAPGKGGPKVVVAASESFEAVMSSSDAARSSRCAANGRSAAPMGKCGGRMGR